MIPPRLPSVTETDYLAGLGNKNQARHQDVKSELKFLFRICQTPWVADFIFNSEMNSLPALTAPLNMSNAICSSVVMTNVQCDNLEAAGLLDVHLTGNFVFVPSFSVGSISVGFGVQECSLLCFTEWCGNNPAIQPSHFRYVRDDKEGILFMVHEAGEGAFFKFEVMSHITMAKRRRTFAMFDKPKLVSAMRTEKGLLHPDAIFSALILMNTVIEDKGCAKCNSPAAGICTCKVVLKPPTHPLDFSSLVRNMRSFSGAYEGLSLSSMFSPGDRIHTAKVGSRISVVPGDDKDLIARLSRWAITDQLKDKVESPFKSMLPPCSDDSTSEQEETTTGIEAIEMALVEGSEAGRGCGNQLMLPVPDNFFESVQQKSARGSSEALSETGILVTDSLENELMGGGAPIAVDQEAPEVTLENLSSASGDAADSDDKVIDLVQKIASGAIAANQQAVDVPISVNKGAAEHSFVESVSSDGTGHGEGGNGVFGVGNGSSSGERSNGTNSRAIAIAPSATIDKRGEMDEKERRALLRKQRNREAAQRSNLRRKQKNDSLKQALKETHARAAELRARELVLREENLKLRKLTSS